MRTYGEFKVTTCPMMAEVELKYKSKTKPADRIKVNRPVDSYAYLKMIWDEDRIDHIEEFVVLMLNRAMHITGWAKISQGGTAGTVCDPKIIFQLALIHNASAIILSHNHPSGNSTPSETDIRSTRKMVDGGKLLDIDVCDHVILSSGGYYSFADEGLI